MKGQDVLDPAIQKIVDDFDAHARKRAAELLASTKNEPLQETMVLTFCLGYKAGIVDLGAAFRERYGASIDQLASVFRAVIAWRDAAENGGVHEQQLVAAIDAVRKEQRR